MNQEIYQDQIIEWSKKTAHLIMLEHAHCSATSSNPLCGDRISVELELQGDGIKSIACQIKGCLLCKAAASILAEQAKGMGFDDLRDLYSDLKGALKSADQVSFPEGFGLFIPVKSHKSRHPCLLLPLEAAIKAFFEYKTSFHQEKGGD